MSVFESYQVILDCAKANLDAMADELVESNLLYPADKASFLVFLMEGIFGYLLGDDCESEE
jgi:hypothetical protein